jgi:hypothetical protein
MILGICGLANSGKDTAAKYIVDDYKFVPMAFADEMKRICKRVYNFTDQQLWGPSEYRNGADPRYPREHSWTDHWRGEVEKGDRQHGYICLCCGLEKFFTPDLIYRVHGAPEYEPITAEPQCYLTPRYALQQLGTGWGRDCFELTWVAVTLRDARLLTGLDPGEPAGYWYDQKRGLLSNVTTQRIPDLQGGVILTDVRYLNEIRAIKTAGGKVIRVIRPGAGLAGGAAMHTSETEQAKIPDAEFDATIPNDETLEALRSRVLQVATFLGVRR